MNESDRYKPTDTSEQLFNQGPRNLISSALSHNTGTHASNMSASNILHNIFNPDTAFGNIMCRLLTLVIILAAAACLYFATVSVFYSSLINIALFITACFLILQAASNIDRTHGFGAFSGSTESNSEQEPPRPDEHHDHHHKPHHKQTRDDDPEQD